MQEPEISLDDDYDAQAPAHERQVHDPGKAWADSYHENTPIGIGARKGMIDRAAVLHDEYGEHQPQVTSRAAFTTFAAIFKFTPAELEQAADAWERAFYRLDRVRSLPR